jgi:hemerythrin
MPIQWREQLSIDRDLIDQDHRTLIAIINRFEAVLPGPGGRALLEDVLDELERYAGVHFRREEQLQRQAGYPYAQEHSWHHRMLMHNVVAARSEYAAAASGPDLTVFRDHMAAFLHDWLLDHIIGNDLPMKPYVAAMAPHAASVEDLHAAVRAMTAAAGKADDSGDQRR